MHPFRLISVLASFLILSITGSVASGGQAEPDMVKPESLPQGFVLVVTDQSGKANKDNPMFFASSINGWNPSDQEYKLTGRSDLRWQMVIDQDLQGVGVQFKFTLGGWDREELNAEGNAIPNRSLPMIDRSALKPGEKPVIELSVVDFREPVSLSEQVRKSGFYHELIVTGDVHRLPVQGGAGGAEAMTRDLQIWTPPGYNDPENAEKTYPVLYMFDGQNLFEHLPGVPGEWHADETATRLIESGTIEPIIVVGIPHSGEHRLSEYLPFGSYRGVEGDGKDAMAWVIREVMPRVERAFRVKTDRESTSIGGASLGGSMALYGATAYPDRFANAIVESLPMLGDHGQATMEYLSSVKAWPDKVFIGMGGKETGNAPEDEDRNKQYRQWARTIDIGLAASGLADDQRKLVIDPDANHNEPAWAKRFEKALVFLYATK
ncbi:MAG: alpha/beta hydrolase [Phycisphaerales bacterium]